MLKAERLEKMEKYISERSFVTLNELCDLFLVHKNTVRADINELEKKGVLVKKYGGVSYKGNKVPTSYEERTSLGTKSKEVIGRLAASILSEDDVIYVDSGTTAAMLFQDASALPERLTVITNNLGVINRCFELEADYQVYTLPGKLEKQLNCFTGVETIESISNFNLSKVFLGCRGISLTGDLTTASLVDAGIKKALIGNGNIKVLMASSDKVGNPSAFNFGQMADVDIWVCDERTEYIKDIQGQTRVKLIVPECEK